jgi:hypothetical protein
MGSLTHRAADQRNRIPDIQARLIPQLEDLRHTVENVDQFSGLVAGMILTTTWDGFTFGYQVKGPYKGGTYVRRAMVKCLEAKISEIPKEERAEIMNSMFEVFHDQGSPATAKLVASDVILFKQVFMPTVLTQIKTARGHIRINDSAIRDGWIIH